MSLLDMVNDGTLDRIGQEKEQQRKRERQEDSANAMYLVQVSTSRGAEPAKIVMPMYALLEMIKAEMETPNEFGTTGAPHYFVVERVDWRK